MHLSALFASIALLWGPVVGAQFDGETVLRFNVTDDPTALADALRRLGSSGPVDVWAATDEFVDVRLHRDRASLLLQLLPSTVQQSYSILIPDLAAAVGASRPTTRPDSSLLSDPRDSHPDNVARTIDVFFEDFQPLPVIARWMQLMDSMFPFVCPVNLGRSAEGREITGLRLGVACKDDGGDGEPRKTIVITGGLHAREWISTSTVAYLAWSFISAYGKERLVTHILDNFDLVLVPVVNPDGYEYTWNGDRLWRKTRQGTGAPVCRGLDLDRAFGYEWDNSTPDACSESYAGVSAFEAVEAVALANWARKEKEEQNSQIIGFVDFHSYSQQILYPFAYSCDTDPPNLENLEEAAFHISKAIRQSSGLNYRITSACNGVGPDTVAGPRPRFLSGGGSAIDWFYHEIGARYSYQIKLRDTGLYGFLLPKEQIRPTGDEMFEALKHVADFLLGNNGRESRGWPYTSHDPLATGQADEETWAEL